MAYKCIAVDDELPALELIKNYVSQVPGLQLLHVFNDAVSASEFLRSNAVDILFVDINMPDINGIDLVNSLEKKPLIIFTTAYKKFAYEGFELEAVDYLLKPISIERFKKAVNKAVEIQQARTQPSQSVPDDSIFVRSEYKMVKVPLAGVDYIEGLEDYIKIHIANSRPVLTLMTMKSFLEKLPADSFLRIHRSYIVSLNKINAVANKKVMLKNGSVLPVSDSYIDELNRYINK
jgi:two-component system, LytTR family, response regulator